MQLLYTHCMHHIVDRHNFQTWNDFDRQAIVVLAIKGVVTLALLEFHLTIYLNRLGFYDKPSRSLDRR